MNALSFALALGALAVPVAWLVSAASLPLLPLVRRLPPVARAEASACMALAPVLAAGMLVAAVSVPSLLHGLGLGPDHCLDHGHHPHVCLWHGAVLQGWLAWPGAAGWAMTGLGLGLVLSDLVRAGRAGEALARLGVAREGVLVIPSRVAVCHAVGVIRPRVLVSRAVIDALRPDELRAAIAHEDAHVDRGDPRWSAVLAVATCLVPITGVAWFASWRQAAEEAADDVAASRCDGPTVARALLAVARLRLAPVSGLAFGSTGVEQRVLRLLAGAVAPRRSRTGSAVGLLVLAASLVVVTAHEPLHHVVEEVWERATHR